MRKTKNRGPGKHNDTQCTHACIAHMRYASLVQGTLHCKRSHQMCDKNVRHCRKFAQKSAQISAIKCATSQKICADFGDKMCDIAEICAEICDVWCPFRATIVHTVFGVKIPSIQRVLETKVRGRQKIFFLYMKELFLHYNWQQYLFQKPCKGWVIQQWIRAFFSKIGEMLFWGRTVPTQNQFFLQNSGTKIYIRTPSVNY